MFKYIKSVINNFIENSKAKQLTSTIPLTDPNHIDYYMPISNSKQYKRKKVNIINVKTSNTLN